jgi:hypothetical protein
MPIEWRIGEPKGKPEMTNTPFYLTNCFAGIQECPIVSVEKTKPVDNQLKKTYFGLLIPVIFGFAAAYLTKTFDIIGIKFTDHHHILATIVFVLSVTFSLALPILYRTLFAHQMRLRQSLSETEWMKFECRFLYIGLVTPYLALLAYLLELPRFHMAGTVFMSLYAAYFYYPSEKRVAFERRIFRVRSDSD